MVMRGALRGGGGLRVVLLFQIKKRGVRASEASRCAQPPAKRDVAETRRWRRRPQRVRPLLASGYDTLESAAAPGRHSFLSIASGSWPLRYSSATRLRVKAAPENSNTLA